MNSPASPLPFTAVLLAGGRSTRMGRDKARLEIDGTPLWQRQLATLRALEPHQVFISGRSDGPYARAGVEIIEDRIPGLGPLGGIAAALQRAESGLVLVLAIDLPAMTPEFVASLVRSGRATIPRSGAHFEPLAAVYPASAAGLAEEFLRDEDRSMQRFARRLVEIGNAVARELTATEASLFRNLNRVEDLDS